MSGRNTPIIIVTIIITFTSMESILNHEQLHRCISSVLKASARKRRRFLESVDLQVAFANYNHERDKCIKGEVVLKHIPKPGLRVCVLGDANHCSEADANALDFKTERDLRDFDRSFYFERSSISPLTNGFDVFLASRQVLRNLKHSPVGDALEAIGKWPKKLSHLQPLVEQVEKAKATVSFCVGGLPWLGLVVGNVEMTPGQLAENIDDVVNHLVGALPGHWDNIRSMHIKSTMGPSQRIF